MQARLIAALAAVALLLLPAALPLTHSAPAGGVAADLEAAAKIHPAFYKKLQSLAGDEEVVVVVRLAPLPKPAADYVRGNYQLAVETLREWARATQEPFIDYVESLGGEVLRTFWIDNIVLVKIRASQVPLLASHPHVVKVFENFEVHLIEPVAERDASVKPGQQVSSWGIFKIDAPGAWAKGYTGEGVRIATLDTGVDITHPALEGKMFTLDPNDPYYPGGWMEFDENGNPVCSQPHDTHGHGTHVSGTALGGDMSEILIGVAPGAQLMHGLVIPGGGGTFAQVLAGIEWAVAPYDCDGEPTGYPAHVISMSLGASSYYGNELLPGIENALLANIIVVAAIGNDGPDTSSNPGNVWGVFGIGATDIDDNVAWFSSGEVVNWPSPPSEWPFYDTYPSTYIKPDFSAPGVDITSAVPGGGYEAWSGTSMATPHVAGTVALILQAMGVLDFNFEDLPETVYEILNESSVDLGDPGQDTRYGWGRINASAAVTIAEQYAKISGVEGYVFDAVDSQPIAWAKVHVVEVNETYTVNRDGYFKIPLDPGNYTLVFHAWGYENKTIQVEVIVLNGTIAGLVYDAQTGDPIAGATVEVVEANATVYTDENGTFQVTVLPGTYTLHVSADGYYNETLTVDVGENETVIVQIPLQRMANGTIAGWVTDASTGDPIANATVWVYVNDQPVYAYTNASGYYELEVPVGTYTVYAAKPGYQQASQPNVTVYENETVIVNFTLEPIPPTVAVVGNVHYYTQPHLAAIVASLGYDVVEYENASDLVADWADGLVYPKVVIIDHWSSDRYSLVDLQVILDLFALAEASGSTLIFLDTSYSGYTGAYMLHQYEADIEAEGYPAPDSYAISYPSPEYVLVYVQDPDHPLFQNVTYDNETEYWFYLADTVESYYADYMIFNFTDDNVTILALVNDTYNGRVGVGVAVWTSPSGAPWFFLASWGESYWMQYYEPGSDGVYSNYSTLIVLENAVRIGMETVSPGIAPDRAAQLLSQLKPLLEPAEPVEPSLYTYIEVYLERQPYGYVTGVVVTEDGEPIAGAKVSAVGTPQSTLTDENGTFTMWLPEGNYTIEVSAEAYYPVYINVTVEANATVDLGVIELEAMPRIAILYDYQLGSFLRQHGYYVVSYDDPYQLAADVAAGLFDLVIWAGHYGTPFPTSSEFWAVVNATESRRISVIWLDSWGYYGYGVKALSAYTGDPATVDDSWGAGNVYIEVLQSHPILEGFEPGQLVEIIAYSDADFAWYDGFTGINLATIVVGGQTYGYGIGYKITESGAKWILLSSFVPTQWNDISYFTEDALRIILNAVEYGLMEPLNVTLSKTEAAVGDEVTVHVAGGQANATYEVYFDDALLGTLQVDENGTGSFTFTVPLVPGGSHTVRVVNETLGQEGLATLRVTAKVAVSPTLVEAPGLVNIEITGLQPSETVHVYLDANWLSKLIMNSSGAFEGVLNIPLVASGTHIIAVVLDNGTVVAEAQLTVTSKLDEIGSDVKSLKTMLSNVQGSLAGLIESSKGEILAAIQTSTGRILVKLDDINSSIAGIVITATGDVKALLDTRIGAVEAGLDALKAEIIGVVQDEAGNLYAVLNTSFGEVLARIDAVNATIVGVTVNAKGEIIATVTDGFNTVNVKLGEIATALDSISAKIDEATENLAEQLAPELEAAKETAETARTTSIAAGAVAAIAAVAAAYGIIRKP